jgi:hypothetical protein
LLDYFEICMLPRVFVQNIYESRLSNYWSWFDSPKKIEPNYKTFQLDQIELVLVS